MRILWITVICCQLFTVIPFVRSQLCLADDIKRNTEYKYRAKNLYKGLTIFTANFLEAMHKGNPNENLFFSPFSLYHALLLAYFGSANQTEKGLKEVLQLHWANSKADVFKGYQFEKKYRDNYEANSSVEFSSIDRFYFDENIQLNPCIEDVVVDETRKLDFKNQPENSLKEINYFVNEATKGNIPKLFGPGDVNQQTQLVLANAAYFKGSWASKFDIKDTKREIFYSKPDELHFVQMMSKNGSYNHAANERLGCHVLEIPYEKSEKVNINMIVFLPPAVGENALEKVLNSLTPEALHEALQDGFEREVQLKIPKFSTEKTIELLPVLRRMRVGDLFDSSANLSGFSTATNLHLDDAIQKAKITLNEEGSTAAAATSLFSFRSSRPAEPAVFHCNHPFLYMIYDQNSRAILFAGIYRGPDKN
ncbi:unnamed protein product [Chironomus riparius]|uniref:Serpin domain-containing protein n=1 Tax=Chironomus riparius TaxID=315576 RepID=A0A9P0J6A4_9DIPT|nr:unnamed protein product [Chironomus riparius]